MVTAEPNGKRQLREPVLQGEMGALIREQDWSSTPLGRIEAWPAHLRFAVDTVLNCGFPATLQWGPDLTLFYNDAYIPLIRARHPVALGRPILDTFPEIAESYAPFVERVRSGESVVLHDQLYRYPRMGQQEDAWFDLSYSPVRDEKGDVAGVLAIGLETTARILAERAKAQASAVLRQSEDRLRRVLETEAVGVLFFDYTGTVVDANEVFLRMTGYNRQDIGSRALTWKTMTPDEYVGISEAQMENLARTGRIGPYEKEYILRDGRRRWMLFAGRDLGDGTIAEYCIDINDRKLAEEALSRSQALVVVGRLASSIAHEINNPLEAVINLIYLAQQEENTSETGKYLEQAQAELSRVAHIATETLRFNKRNTSARPTNIGDVMESVITLHEGRLRAAGIRVERRIRPHRPAVLFANELRQVVANLVGNAIDAMQERSERRLLLRVHEATHPRTGRPGVRFTIGDTGGGMPPSTLRRLFEPFFTTKEATGTGLGLWVSQEIIRKHHGTMRVRSCCASAPTGTVFSVFIPHEQTENESSAG